jgi:CRP-like cAMP-binding protein
MDVAAKLKLCPLFHGFSDVGIDILAPVFKPRTFPAGTPLFVENMVSSGLLVMVQGQASLTLLDAHGSVMKLCELGPGDCMGLLALLSQEKRQCTATAFTEVEALELPADRFHALMAKKPQACTKLLMNISLTVGEVVAGNIDAFKRLVAKAQ